MVAFQVTVTFLFFVTLSFTIAECMTKVRKTSSGTVREIWA